MPNYLDAYLITLGIFLIIDAVWLGLISARFYRERLGFIMAKRPNLVAAAAFYLIFNLGLTVFVVYPTWQGGHGPEYLILPAGLFGLVGYATYDLTNQATIRKWPLIVTIVDLCWGVLLCVMVSLASLSMLKLINH